MDAKTSAALEASIKHWERNVAAETIHEADISADDCALCGMFFRRDCDGCPVMQRTGKTACFSSPYGRALLAYTRWFEPNDRAKYNWRIAAQAELDFLISLREPAPQELREAAS